MYFCILKIFNTETKDLFYKLYRFNLSEWAINSGIKDFKETEEHITFTGYSGSSYCVSKDRESEMTFTGPSIEQLQNVREDLKVELISFEDFKKEFVSKL